MKKMGFVVWPLIVVSCIILLMNSTAFAHEKVVVIPLNSSSAKIPNNTSNCDSSTAGVLRWTGSVFEGCNGTDWTLLSPVPTVYSSGHEWMDRNIGASRVATSPTDTAAYGDLYQWGRYADGHEKRNSLVTSLNDFSSSDVPGHGDFIITSSSPFDWRSPQNNILWQDSGINNPCPAGFRLPTDSEWEAEIVSWSSYNAAGAYNSPLKLVPAGYRGYSNGTLKFADSYGNYWSSTVEGSYSHHLYFSSSNSSSMFNNNRANGFSVRCLKD